MAALRWLATALLLTVQFAVAGPSLASPCARDSFEGSGFIVCSVDPTSEGLQLFWQDQEQEPYRRFAPLSDAVAETGRSLVFAINAGMYGHNFSPIGLYVENGIQLRPINQRIVEGPPAQVPNFYKRPNGVFFIDEDGAGVLTTDAYVEQAPSAQYASQSGPMLVIEGVLHPAFIVGSTDRTRRSGVGVCEGGVVRFAATDGRINFHDFARLFRDHLSCPNALFLDGGNGVGIHVPSLGRSDWSWHGGYGPMFGLVE